MISIGALSPLSVTYLSTQTCLGRDFLLGFKNLSLSPLLLCRVESRPDVLRLLERQPDRHTLKVLQFEMGHYSTFRILLPADFRERDF